MAEFLIKDEDLSHIKGKVVIVTGGSFGIGLATANLLLSLGASVVNGDIQPPAEAESHGGALTFVETDVTRWADLVALFRKAKEVHGRIDHVFANAGIGPRADYLSTAVDENGDLKEPTYDLLDVGLKGLMNTATLAVYYIRQQTEGGSIVLNGSTTGLQRLRAVDYATAKHGVLGFGRGLSTLVKVAGLPIRVNTLTPTWTDSNVLPNLKQMMDKIGVEVQPPSAVGRAAVAMMADSSRHGHVIHIARGRYKEIDEAVLLPAFESIKGDYPWEDDVLRRLMEATAN
ncbi:hypothetical protein JX265_013479 [Neoarthrinium moseri]|uniref:Uncharacterized protein n=1 Tax=Neoarthrinium moseri TaxID=1658444 RepID=A0A9P9W8E9_9PEZI|nr:hypothetical protein JX266_012266 [Neoarthrinium moseri]KAI1849892.1 hypothetical protein JX265_013479 [Neoarthrinium moseri]